MIRRPFALAMVLVFAVVSVLGGHLAYATPQATSNSSAFGVSADLALGVFNALNPAVPISATVDVGPLPTASGTAPPPYNVTETAVAGSANVTAQPVIGTLLTTGILSATAASNVSAASTDDSVSASASVQNLDLNIDVPVLNDLGVLTGLADLLRLRADTVTSNASVLGPCGGPLVASGSTSIVNGLIAAGGAEVGILASPAPNTNLATVLIAAGGSSALVGNALNTIGATILLNEQIVSGDGTTTRSITVNAIHVTLDINSTVDPVVLPGGAITLLDLAGDIIVSQSQATLSCAAAPGSANLSITKTDAPDPVTVGNPLTYLLTVANAGPDAATNVVVTDALPAGATLVSATPSQGTCSGTTTVTCNLGTVASGGSATVTIVVTPTAAGTLTNTATVGSNRTDPNTSNNIASTTTAVTGTATGAGDTGTGAGDTAGVGPNPNDPNNDDEEDERHKETDEQRRNRERTNTGNRDDEHTEGNVLGVRCTTSDPIPVLERGFIVEPDVLPYVLIANRDEGAQKILLVGDVRTQCQYIRIGDYLEADGEKQSEALFHADGVSVKKTR